MLLQCIPLRIHMYKSCLFQFSPRLFGSTNALSTLRSLSREVFSHRGSTVGPGSITMKPKISPYAYRSQNLDEACILNGCSTYNWKDAWLSVYIFSKTRLFEVPPRISAKSTFQNLRGHRWNNVKDICCRKKSKNIVTVWKQFCPAFGFSRDKKYFF